VLAWRAGLLATTPPPSPLPPPPLPPPQLQSAWATEEEWLVDRITRDIGEMAAYATTRTLPATDLPRVKPQAIRFDGHLFSPGSYEAIARQALGAVGSDRSPAANDAQENGRLLATLLDLRASVLVREDLSLSRRLETEPAEPGAHERAALLLGAFALRDLAGRSTDTRPALTRLTAHLAVARALRAGQAPGLAGRFADALLVTLVGRQREALAKLDALEAGARTTSERMWVRALRLRNTGDWRMVQDEGPSSLLVRLEEFRALVKGKDDASAVTWLEQRRPDPVPDWGLIALNGDSLSVDTASRFADPAIEWELAEGSEVLRGLRRTPDAEASLLEVVNERPSNCVTRGTDGQAQLSVLGWGLWADRIQRNLIFEIMTAAYSRGKLFGQPGERHAFAERARQRFGRLDLYPLALRALAPDAVQYRAAMAGVREIALRAPERLTGGHWQLLRTKLDFAPVPRDLPDENMWFRPALPTGTLVDLDRRLPVLGALQAIKPDLLAELRAEAPYNVALAGVAATYQAGDKRSVADLVTLYGPLADFNVAIMGKLADASWYIPAAFRERQGALCRLVASKCFVLGHRLAEMGFPDEAAAAYQDGFDRTPDRVFAANGSRWLVEYYFEHGQTRKAEATARAAAAVYSQRGLFSMAWLMERMGRLPEAEEYYRRILDRYNGAGDLAGFYYRQARVAKRPAYEPKLRDALALALPAGLEPLDRASLPSPPADGVLVKGENDNTKKYGIKWGNVICAVDGFRVRDPRAYDVVVALSQSPHMKLVVWRDKAYHDVEVDLWDRQFRVELAAVAPDK
jgi:tetratricopeptide (TPR) repeat protein